MTHFGGFDTSGTVRPVRVVVLAPINGKKTPKTPKITVYSPTLRKGVTPKTLIFRVFSGFHKTVKSSSFWTETGQHFCQKVTLFLDVTTFFEILDPFMTTFSDP